MEALKKINGLRLQRTVFMVMNQRMGMSRVIHKTVMTREDVAPPFGPIVTTYKNRMGDDVRNQKECLTLLIKLLYIYMYVCINY